MALQLPAVSENILMENLSVFEKNGFSFHIKRRGRFLKSGRGCLLETDGMLSFRFSAEPTKRVSLTKIPYSKSCQFGKQDVEELIYLLEVRIRLGQVLSRRCLRSLLISPL